MTAADPLRIELCWRLRTDWRAASLLKRVARHVAAAEGFSRGELSLVVVGDRAMRTLHRRFLGHDAPTDVITFDLGVDRTNEALDGEIVVCADVARRQAPEATRAAARRELALYVAHGVLHLAGYDDHRPDDYARMHAREDELLAELGLGCVFGDGAAG